MTSPHVSIVIPVYRGSKTIEELYLRVKNVFDLQIRKEFEIIFVDDASPDDSWEVMKKLRERDNRIKIITFARNFGQHPAILCGMRYATGEFVVTMDDDLQHPPEEIPKLLNDIINNEDCDVIIGKYVVKNHNLLRNFGTFIINKATNSIFDKSNDLRLTSFRVLRKNVVADILQFSTESPRIGQIILQVTNKIKNVDVVHSPRKVGKSGYTFSKLIKDFLDNIISNSALPLKFVTYIGVFSFVVAFLLVLVYLYKYFFVGISISGWTTVILILLLCFGFLFLSIGIIGEYLIRILREAKKLPQYIIRKKDF